MVFHIYKHPNLGFLFVILNYFIFLNENTYTDRIYVKNIRKQLAIKLAENDINNFQIKNNYIVVGIPQSGILYGKEYAKKLHLPYFQVITRNKNISRTFIILNNEDRKKICDEKIYL